MATAIGGSVVLELFRNLHPVFSAASAIIAVVGVGVSAYKFWKEFRIKKILSGDEHELWHFRSASPPGSHQKALNDTRTSIITVANLEDGLGRRRCPQISQLTSISLGKRVLVVDADYQGSIAALLMGAAGIDEIRSHTETRLAEGASSEELRASQVHLQEVLPLTWLVPALPSRETASRRSLRQRG